MMFADKCLVWVYESESPLIFEDEEKARLCARKLHGKFAKVDPLSISDYGLNVITDIDKLRGYAG